MADLGLERSPTAERGLITWAIVVAAFALLTVILARRRRSFLRARSTSDSLGRNARGWPFMKRTLYSIAQVAAGVMTIYALARMLEPRPQPRPGWKLIRPPEEATVLAVHDNLVWAGGRAGLFPIDSASVALVEIPAVRSHDLRGVRALLSDGDTLWVGCNQGLFRLRAGRLERIQREPELGPVGALHRDGDGAMWVGVKGGAWRVDPSFTDWKWFGIDLPSVDLIYKDRDGGLWFGSNLPEAAGLFRFDPATNAFTNIATGLPNPAVNDMLEDNSGTLWIATGFGARGGAARLVADRWEPAADIPEVATHKIRSLFQDTQGRFWFCSEYDGVAIRGADGWKRLKMKDGLPGNELKDILYDNAGRLWLATERGVGCLATPP